MPTIPVPVKRSSPLQYGTFVSLHYALWTSGEWAGPKLQIELQLSYDVRYYAQKAASPTDIQEENPNFTLPE